MLYHKNAQRCGAAAVELAFLLPLLCLLFVLAVDFARIFYISVTVTNCARNGAAYGSADPVAAQDQTGITTAAQADATNLNLKQLQIVATTDAAAPPTYLDVTVSYPFSTISQFPGVPNLTLSRTVRMRIAAITPN